jgi:hypothetical protein
MSLQKTNLKKDKSVMFFSCSSPRHYDILYDFGIRETLVSYFYFRKSPARFGATLDMMLADGGIFMADSGGHSFMAKKGDDDAMFKEAYWIPFIEEYVAWLIENREKIYCAANMDLEMFVGKKVVDKWNRLYFEPLLKYFEVIFVAHEDTDDPYGVKRFEEYAKRYRYVGINNVLYKHAAKFYNIAKQYGTRIHGFGWTSIPTLKQYPFFSVDSTTWLGGEKFGASYRRVGNSLKTLPSGKRHIRRGDKSKCIENGISFEGLMAENYDDVDRYNLMGWVGAREIMLKFANMKLSNRPVFTYKK